MASPLPDGLPQWIRVAATGFDLATGERIDDGAPVPPLSPGTLDTLRKLVRKGAGGDTAWGLGKEEPGDPPRTRKQRIDAGHHRVGRLRAALGPCASQLVCPEGTYRLHFTVDVPRGQVSANQDRLQQRIAGRLGDAGWRVTDTHVASGDRVVSTAALLDAPGWLAASAELRFLPPLLGADRPVPLATVYVTLRLAGATTAFDPALLGGMRSLADAMADRRRRREARALGLE